MESFCSSFVSFRKLAIENVRYIKTQQKCYIETLTTVALFGLQRLRLLLFIKIVGVNLYRCLKFGCYMDLVSLIDESDECLATLK